MPDTENGKDLAPARLWTEEPRPLDQLEKMAVNEHVRAERVDAENERLRHICQRIRAGWLPHRLGNGSWWWGRPRADGFDLWRQGLVPSMSIVDRMTPEEIETWVATLNPYARELDGLAVENPDA